MASDIQKMKKNLLREDHPLYEKIIAEKPIWWQFINSDNDFYVEIRKGNVIDVYYRGGRVAQISFKKGVFVATAHPKYTADNVSKDDPRYYKNSKDAIYQECLELISYEDGLAKMKCRIKEHYATDDEDNVENTSEKYIQGGLIVKHRHQYLDSEFAYKFLSIPRSRKTIRFDLVQIKDGKIVFVELKRFWDNRMRTSKGEPEILEQMTNYINFIKENEDELCDYYKVLYKIKVKLGLPVPSIDDINKLSIELRPELLVAMCHEESKHGKDAKQNRKNYIDKKLKTLNIAPQYFDL